MTNNILDSLAGLIDAAVEVQDTDMTETGTGGFDRIVLPKGKYNARFVEYVEYGKRTPMYQGKPTGKAPVLEVKVGFIFYGPNGEQVPIRSLRMKVSNSEKAVFKQLFDRLNTKGTLRHAAQRLGQAFRIELDVVEKDGKEYNTVNFASLDELPKFDPETGKPVELPELDPKDIKIFLWAKPTKETWDSLYIDGVNEKTGKSKNFIQNDILEAVDYVGSPLQQLIEGKLPTPADLAPPSDAVAGPTGEASAAAPEAPSAPAAPSAPVAPTAPTA